MDLKKASALLISLAFLFSTACSFTIVTQIEESSVSIGDREYTRLEPVDFVVNAVSLESAYPWHGIYHIVPSSYKPPQKDESSGNYLEGCSPSDKKAVLVWFMEPKKPGFNFIIDLENKTANPDWTKLDCEAGVGYTTWAELGKTIPCDTMSRADGIGKSGIIEYRIDSIESAEYICGYGKGLYGAGYGCTLQDPADRTVRINFSVRLRLDGSTYSDWISSPGSVTIGSGTYEITTSLRRGNVEVAGDELGDETKRALGGTTTNGTGGSEQAEGESPTVEGLDDFLRGIGECSSEIQSVDITNSVEDGKIYICDEQKNAVSNTISVSLNKSSCSLQKTCITLWRQSLMSGDFDLGSADLSGDGVISEEEKYYFTLLWWLYVAGEHYGLEPYGTDSENDFKTKAAETLSSYFFEQVKMITWDTWFAHNTYTKCFEPSEELSFSISKDSTETDFLNTNVGLFGQNVYLTVQELADYEGKHVWFIARNYFTLPLVNNCAETQAPSGEQQGPIVVNGPVNPEQPGGEQPGPSQPQQLAGCNPCLSPIGCLGCIDILILQSLPHQ